MKTYNLYTSTLLAITILFTISCKQKPSSSKDQESAKDTTSWGAKMTHTVMSVWKDPEIINKSPFGNWNYEEGVIFKGIEGQWELTGNAQYFNYIKHNIDYFVDDSGNIDTYDAEAYKLDAINTGKTLLMLYRVTGDKKYWKAAAKLRDQLKTQPRTYDGGFWHKKIYVNQMWLDGLYMAEPFYAEYAMLAHEDTAFNDVARQFILMEKHSRDPETGLLYHGWDASKKQRWSDPKTGTSPHFWDRAMGWYAMALVDALDYFPHNSPYRDSLIQILNRLAVAIAKVQDPETGCWWQVMDKGDSTGNFLEASGSCMFVYSLAKGTRMGYLPEKFMAVAQKGFDGVLKQFIVKDENGLINLKGTCPVAGLGGDPYRDGSYEYYIKQKPRLNDPKGIGAFILAANEMQIATMQPVGNGLTVTLDNYFNHEIRKDMKGVIVPFHYEWNDMANSGYSLWGNIFEFRGVKTTTLKNAPTTDNLKNTDIYIIVDPDTKQETPTPNFINESDVKVITNWVQSGGVLVLMSNDSTNSEFKHLNRLAKQFGFQFNGDSKNRVQGHNYEQGALVISDNNPIFTAGDTVYIKELSTLTLEEKVKPVLKTKDGNTVAAVASLGRGVVVAIGDPWFYNEYTDGRKLPSKYKNYRAACDLADWLIQQVHEKH